MTDFGSGSMNDIIGDIAEKAGVERPPCSVGTNLISASMSGGNAYALAGVRMVGCHFFFLHVNSGNCRVVRISRNWVSENGPSAVPE